MQIQFINNDGGGFANFIPVDEGTTISQLFNDQFPDASPSSYLIRVNRAATTADYVLQEGDRVSVTPTKIDGAAA